MYFPDRGCVRTLRTLYVYATGGWGTVPDPAGGAYRAPSDPLTGFEGEGGEGREERGREGKGREGKERRGAGREGKGRGGEGRMTLMRSWNRAADWLRPAMMGTSKCYHA